MFTKRERYLDSYDDIVTYLKDFDFHDYRVGGFEFDLEQNKMQIFVEEVIPGKKLEDSAGKIWDFTFRYIEKCSFNLDLVLGLYIYDLHGGNEPGEIVLEGDGGNIYVASKEVSLGIPG